MRRIVLFDTEAIHADLLPISYTRPTAAFRLGIRTIREQWEELLPGEYFYRPVEFQRDKFGTCPADEPDMLFIAGNAVPDERLAIILEGLRPGEALRQAESIVAFRGSESQLDAGEWNAVIDVDPSVARVLTFVYDIFQANGEAVKAEYRRVTRGRKSQPLSDSNRVIGEPVDAEGNPMIFLEEGASVEGAIINVKEGPVYIGADAVVMEGACLRGPIALCRKAQVKMGGKIYGGTTFGPYCKIGGEVQNAVIFGYRNKAHDGYLGNAVIGEWCNLGA
ncbi:MAG: glucose-1-phosphate thymidylyltransferase, partial [Muribaculaceae bacterium]|nr:glucose-1-phosphate thymidylyltransferase [Muribaculaceae bacterium]